MTITGTAFTWATMVTIGGSPAPSFAVISDTQITFTVWSGMTGPISVTTPAGTATSTSNFLVYPLGTGIGIHPGRVAWVRDPNAVQGTLLWDNADGIGYFWDDTHNNQSNIDAMMGTTVCWLAGESNQPACLGCALHYFNNAHGNGDVGYQPGQTVVIKVDLSNSINRTIAGVSDDKYYNNTLDANNMPVMYDFYQTGANEPDVSPQADHRAAAAVD